MRKWTMTLAPVALALTLSACNGTTPANDAQQGRSDSAPADQGSETTRSFALSGFTGVKVTGPDDVKIRRGDSFSISAKGLQANLDELEITVDGQTLSIGRKSAGFSVSPRNKSVDITITMPALRAVRLTGSGSVDADQVEGDAVEAVLTGSGDLKIARLTGKSVNIKVTGSGDIDIDGGTSGSADVSVTGSGDVDADDLVVTTLTASIAGSGNIDMKATGTADVRVMGSGDATIGGGATCTQKKMGSGSITCK